MAGPNDGGADPNAGGGNADPNAGGANAGGADPNAGGAAGDGAGGNAGAAGGTASGEGGGDGRQTPWFMRRINEETNRRQAAEERAAELERRAADAEALLSRVNDRGGNQGGQGNQNQGGQSGGQGDQRRQPPADRGRAAYEQDVRVAAQQQRLYEETLDIRANGSTAFGAAFDQSLKVLQAAGATSDDFVLDVLAVNRANAHAMLHELAKNPEQAAMLAAMDSRKRTAELTKMSLKMGGGQQQGGAAGAEGGAGGAGANKNISGAPRPQPNLGTNASSGAANWQDPASLDKMSEDEANRMFSAEWDKKFLGKGAAA